MKIFRWSLEELKSLRAVIVTGLLIALSMVIESFTINLGFAKINFAFLAIAAIGMLYGPSVSLFAGAVCDVLGYMVAPDGAFFPLYTLIGAAQGLIYGLIAYRRIPTRTGRFVRDFRRWCTAAESRMNISVPFFRNFLKKTEK